MFRAFKRERFYYGWYIAYALAVTETFSYGIIFYAFSVFLTSTETELGWSRGQISGAFSLMMLVTAVMAFPIGVWVDKHGSRLLMTAGSIGATLLLLAWSQVDSLVALYLIWAGLGVCGAAVWYEPAFAVIATWFTKRRGTALAIVTFAAGFASTIFVPLSDALLGAFGWRGAVIVLAIAYGAVTVPLHALVLRRSPQDMGLPNDTPDDAKPKAQATLSEALHSRFFWLLTLAFSLSGLASAAIRFHFLPLLQDSGVNASVAAYASGAIGTMQVLGRVLFAPLDRRFSGRVMIIGLFTMQVMAMSTLLMGVSVWVVAVFVMIFGTSIGAITLVRPSILADVFGTASYGRISSIMSIFITLAATAAPVGAGLLYDQFQSYTPVLWIIVVVAIASVAVILLPSAATQHDEAEMQPA